MSKRTLILLGLLLILIAAGSYYAFRLNPQWVQKAEAQQFVGSIVSIEGKTLTLRGIYGGLSNNAPKSLTKERELSFLVDDSTHFEKLEVRPPPQPVIAPNSSSTVVYDFKDLPSTEGPGSLEDLKRAFALYGTRISVDADFFKNIYGEDKPTAALVFYTVVTASQ